MPEIVIATLPEEIARAESHDEIRDLLGWSVGLNVGLAFVPGALATDMTRAPIEGPEWAADVVWFDSLTINPDRTPRNANLIIGAGSRTWLIDHGSALYVHHAWNDPDAHAARPFERIGEHVLLPFAAPIADADARLAARLDPETVERIVDDVPEAWLRDSRFGGPSAERDAYRRYLAARIAARPTWVAAADALRLEAQRDAVA